MRFAIRRFQIGKRRGAAPFKSGCQCRLTDPTWPRPFRVSRFSFLVSGLRYLRRQPSKPCRSRVRRPNCSLRQNDTQAGKTSQFSAEGSAKARSDGKMERLVSCSFRFKIKGEWSGFQPGFVSYQFGLEAYAILSLRHVLPGRFCDSPNNVTMESRPLHLYRHFPL